MGIFHDSATMSAMGIERLTPKASPRAFPATPSILIKTEKTKGAEARTFERQQELDRRYYAQHIHEMILADRVRWAARPQEDRVRAILAKRKQLIKKRNGNAQMRTTEWKFEDQHDEEEEVEWLKEQFEDWIEGCGEEDEVERERKSLCGRYISKSSYKDPSTSPESGRDDDDGDDDEEPTPQAIKSEPGVKTEPVMDLQESIEVAMKPADKKVEKKEECTAFSLTLRLRLEPGIATKSYWGYHDMMEMVLIEPMVVKTDEAGGDGGGLKRRFDSVVDGGGAAKKARI